MQRQCTSRSAGQDRLSHLSGRLGVHTQGALPWAYSHLRIGVRIFTQLGELLRRALRRRLRSKKHCAVEGGKRVYAPRKK